MRFCHEVDQTLQFCRNERKRQTSMSDDNAWQFTLGMIKPHAVASGAWSYIIDIIEKSGLHVISRQELTLSDDRARHFYEEHADKPFFINLVSMMTEGPVMPLLITGPNAIQAYRRLMGPTSPEGARMTHPDSIRAIYGVDKTRNAVHGSDSAESAAREVRFFFPEFVQKIPTADELAEYAASENMQEALTKGLVAMTKAAPADPVAWLGEWLISYSRRNCTVEEPEE
ncbi:Nucleoside diphosphate kinase [Carpediemonas membranifera]|uniref:Nucleoside diphosphate kinase n=1 Tax=Carpediemonas membranifera TaxID=201153 RepID=A0A8J6BUK8_9EUKA|nr:Nucleoside diphosphate kinase [Carpediemonas membranifera]|eukprot:KAG9390456.1 Nucleoside diphosphate kinase [Carpediemonas membranifera]